MRKNTGLTRNERTAERRRRLSAYLMAHPHTYFRAKTLAIETLVPLDAVYRYLAAWEKEGKIVKSTPGKPLYRWRAAE